MPCTQHGKNALRTSELCRRVGKGWWGGVFFLCFGFLGFFSGGSKHSGILRISHYKSKQSLQTFKECSFRMLRTSITML